MRATEIVGISGAWWDELDEDETEAEQDRRAASEAERDRLAAENAELRPRIDPSAP